MSSSHSGSKTIHRIVFPTLLVIALLFSLIEFIITAVLVHDYNDRGYPSNSIRDRLRFLLFTSVWCLAFLPVYIFVNLRLPGQVLSSIASNLGFMVVTWIFWLSGAAAWTDALGGNLHCGDLFFGNQFIDVSIPYCNSLRAVQAFAWMTWITLSAALLYISGVAFWAKSKPSGLTGPMREVPPPAAV